MPTIHLTTFIAAPVERVFNLSRSIELHKKAMTHTGEQAVAGTTMGLIGLHETVTWKAKHLYKIRIMKVKVTAMEQPFSFTDEMVEGAFKSMKHEHHFKPIENGTLAIDIFSFETPYGAIGKMINTFYLRKYMEQLLELRNKVIREYAESDKWKFILQ
ncbi:SRPBCC family protein [Pseudoflavitalea sp. X16]|uniref:SRPBCC family protein n=1 Tax=Paraflavitalea devenefica TaxID=2716334 RepID=UPI001423AD37|nr:SRPBCC family protein [Paraflavitalea devenefica]NII24574.1 SRPBCC family protein [Paraflavitalea devenefica]